MARRVTVDINDLVDDWRTKTNTISLYFGDLDQLQTSEDSDLVGAINEINVNAKDSATIQSMIDSAVLENNNIYYQIRQFYLIFIGYRIQIIEFYALYRISF